MNKVKKSHFSKIIIIFFYIQRERERGRIGLRFTSNSVPSQLIGLIFAVESELNSQSEIVCPSGVIATSTPSINRSSITLSFLSTTLPTIYIYILWLYTPASGELCLPIVCSRLFKEVIFLPVISREHL